MRKERTIEQKIQFLIENEGLNPKQAAGKAYGMARHGDLGPGPKRKAGRRPPRKRRKS